MRTWTGPCHRYAHRNCEWIPSVTTVWYVRVVWLATRPADAGIRVRDIPANGTVRASVHVFNTADDVDALLDEL